MKRFEGKKKLWFIPIMLGGLALLILVTKLLWNRIMPGLFHLPLITYWEAAGILILSRLILGFGGHHCGRYHGRNHFRDKWEKMNPEDREKFRQRIHGFHRGHWHETENPASGQEV